MGTTAPAGQEGCLEAGAWSCVLSNEPKTGGRAAPQEPDRSEPGPDHWLSWRMQLEAQRGHTEAGSRKVQRSLVSGRGAGTLF